MSNNTDEIYPDKKVTLEDGREVTVLNVIVEYAGSRLWYRYVDEHGKVGFAEWLSPESPSSS